VPFHEVGAKQAAVVSEDNGITWSIRPIPDSTTNGESDLNNTIPANARTHPSVWLLMARSILVTKQPMVTL